MKRCQIDSFKYCSFFKLYYSYQTKILDSINSGSVNYDSGTIYFNDFVKVIAEMISTSYAMVEEMIKGIKQEKRAFKHDNITRSIMEDLPRVFSKADIKKLYPNASDSTIVRALIELRDKNFITPLGSGRSACWQRIVDKNNPRYLFGDNDND